MFIPNPYIAGNPVVSQGKLVGRETVVRDVKRVLQHPYTHAMVLFGQRRIGKTSVLLHLEHCLLAGAEYLPVYVDLQEQVHANISVDEMLYGIAQKIALQTQAPPPQKARFDPQGCFFRKTFVPAILKLSKRKGLVVLFDEFDMLDIPGNRTSYSSLLRFLWDWIEDPNGLQFIFVLGRRPGELSPGALALFKTFPAQLISLLSQEESLKIIRQSELDGSLEWTDDARNWVWYWTQGHPFFTQLLCSEVWEICMDRAEMRPPPVEADDVEEALDVALERGANQFQWLWDGFPAAERIVAAVMASMTEEYITRETLKAVLAQQESHLLMRELELAPENLLRWDILRREDEGFRFAIPLFRLWVKSEKALDRIRVELDNLEPVSEQLYNF